jgi:hypothetical protein
MKKLSRLLQLTTPIIFTFAASFNVLATTCTPDNRGNPVCNANNPQAHNNGSTETVANFKPAAFTVATGKGFSQKPAAPSRLGVTTLPTTTQISLGWVDNADNETGFIVERCQGITCTNYAPIMVLGANSTTFTDTGLFPGITYNYVVRAYNNYGNNASIPIQVSTAGSGNTAPAAPTNLVGNSASTSQINLSWQDNSNNEDGFKIELCQNSTCNSSVQIGTTPANRSTFAVTGLSPNTTYYYRVRSYKNTNNSGYSNITAVTTLGNISGPSAPSNLAGIAVSTSQINLTWADNANNENGFKIERCQGSATCTNFAPLTTVAANVTAYSDSGLLPGTIYRYQIRATNGNGDSVNSNIATVTTLIPGTPPAAPGSLQAFTRSGYRIQLAWSDNSTDEVGFRIEYCVGFNCSDFLPLTTATANANGVLISGLASGSYRFRIQAYNGAGSSGYSLGSITLQWNYP